MKQREYVLPTKFNIFSTKVEKVSFLLTNNYKQNMFLLCKCCEWTWEI